MYRSSAKRLKRWSLWTLTTFVAIGGGAAAANLTMSRPSSTASRTSVTTTSVGANLATLTTAKPTSLTTRVLPSTVVTVSSTSLTVQRGSGVATYALAPSTIVLIGRTRISASSIKVGERVFVVAQTSSASTAATIGILPASYAGRDDAGSDA